MYLKSLKVRGFKSFARKTVFEFRPGVTIIVGPNGSGKSNVADAVMWVLGEQSPLSLRGSRMEDVIFSGSSSARPVNVAEVVLTLDNSNGDFPLDYSEITVTRNVVRGSESEYRLNNGCCRLLDIQELLSDAGVGRTLNSVVSQGKLDEVLNCRPEERRDYIEEAGGLLKYRRRREKALRRIERMEEELLRVKDVLREVKRQLRPLRKQADRLEKYKELNGELKEARLRLDVSRLNVLQKEWDGFRALQEERGVELERLDAELESHGSRAAELERAAEEWRSRESDLRDKLYRLVSLHERLKAMKPAPARDSVEELPEAGGVDPAEYRELVASNREHEKSLRDLEEEAGAIELRETEIRKKCASANREIGELSREIASLEARIEVLGSPVTASFDTGEGNPAGFETRLDELENNRREITSKAERLRAEEQSRHARLEELEEEIDALATRRLELAERIGSLKEEEAALVTTLDMLNRLDTRHWDVENSTGALLKADPTNGGLGGTLIQAMKVEPEYTRAVLNYLGPWAFGVIARDADAVRASIMYLKEKELGQSHFFRYTPAGGGATAVSDRTAPAGAVPARSVVEAPDWFADALDALLDGVYIAGDLDEAFSLAAEYPLFTFLSPDGDTVSSGTLLKGGSPSVNRAHLEMTGNRRDELEESLAECKAGLDTAALESNGLAARMGELSSAKEEAAVQLEEARKQHSDARCELAGCMARIETLQEIQERGDGFRSALGEAEIEDMRARLSELREEYGSLNECLQGFEKEQEAVFADRRRVGDRMSSLRQALGEGMSREQELKESLLLQRVAGAGQGVPRESAERLEELYGILLGRIQEARSDLYRRIEQGSGSTHRQQEELNDLRQRASVLQKRHEDLKEEIHGDELSSAELKIKVEQLVENIVDGHKVPLEFALNQCVDGSGTEELQGRISELESQLEHIGPVNPEAITEREALEERYDFLTGQMEDLKESKTGLKRIIGQIDREIKEKFQQTFDDVNRHLKDIYSFLCPGGKAELSLTDPDDLLNTGVDILAKPEGKKILKMSLLSGGESALVALAFFFALFRVRPSPFYFLDEVEAALDDFNLHRFLELVKEFKEESQLVMITHQKRSMEIADVLYGVTMHDDGISRVVSQKVAG